MVSECPQATYASIGSAKLNNAILWAIGYQIRVELRYDINISQIAEHQFPTNLILRKHGVDMIGNGIGGIVHQVVGEDFCG